MVGLDVVLDLNFWTRAERDRARRLAAEAGATAAL
jgi:predicted kinase